LKPIDWFAVLAFVITIISWIFPNLAIVYRAEFTLLSIALLGLLWAWRTTGKTEQPFELTLEQKTRLANQLEIYEQLFVDLKTALPKDIHPHGLVFDPIPLNVDTIDSKINGKTHYLMENSTLNKWSRVKNALIPTGSGGVMYDYSWFDAFEADLREHIEALRKGLRLSPRWP